MTSTFKGSKPENSGRRKNVSKGGVRGRRCYSINILEDSRVGRSSKFLEDGEERNSFVLSLAVPALVGPAVCTSDSSWLYSYFGGGG